MWRSVDWKTRLEMASAPEALVEPIQRLVTIARNTLRYPDHIDERGTQYAYREFVSLKHVAFKISLGNGPVTIAAQECGLFIAQMEIGPIGVPIEPPQEIEIPQVRPAVSVSSIYNIRGILPDAITEAIEQLLYAIPITRDRWEQLVRLAPLTKTKL